MTCRTPPRSPQLANILNHHHQKHNPLHALPWPVDRPYTSGFCKNARLSLMSLLIQWCHFTSSFHSLPPCLPEFRFLPSRMWRKTSYRASPPSIIYPRPRLKTIVSGGGPKRAQKTLNAILRGGIMIHAVYARVRVCVMHLKCVV